MTANWRRNPEKFVARMNSNVSYQPHITVVFNEDWDAKAKEGTIRFTHKETDANFDLVMKYIKEDKILAFYDPEKYNDPECLKERLQPWRLIKEMIKTKEAPTALVPFEPPAIKKLKEEVRKPCPPISLTPLELDVLFNGIFSNPENNIKDPWNHKAKTLQVPSKTISANARVLNKKKVPSAMASLTKKGLIKSTGKETQRICSVTFTGALVLRREILGA